MAFKTPLWQENSTYSATLDRELIDALYDTQGVLAGPDLVVSQRGAGANMSVDVAIGRCVITGTTFTGQGKYLCKSDAVANVIVPNAPGAGQSRIDLIVAQLRDADSDGGTHNDWLIVDVPGTPATTGSQVAPALPVSSLLLASVLVGSSVSTIVTGNITEGRSLASNLGGRPAGRIWQSVAQSIPNNASTQLTNFTASFSGCGMGIGTGSLIVPVTGIYQLNAQVAFDFTTPTIIPNAGFRTACIVEVNGALKRQGETDISGTSSGFCEVTGIHTASVGDLIALNSGDALTLWGFQTQGGAISTYATNDAFTFLSAQFVSR